VKRAACEAQLDRIREQLADLDAKLQQAQRQRDLAETRGWRWLNHAITCDDAVLAMIEHIESEIRLGRGNAAHRRILDRLAELHEAFPV
jgi:hypothetical protein